MVFQSSLLLAACGELSLTSGGIQCRGRLAYVAQEPWIFSASIRQNILFSEEYDEQKYCQTIDVCQLNQVNVQASCNTCSRMEVLYKKCKNEFVIQQTLGL